MKKTIGKCVVLLLFVVSCEDNTGYEISPSAVPDNVAMPGEEYVNDWIRVKFTRETGDYIHLATDKNGAVQTGVAEIDEMMSRLGVTKIENVFSEGGKFRERRREAGLHLWYDVYTGNLSPIAQTRSVNTLAELPFITLTERIPVYKQEESAADKYINQSYSLALEANSGYAPEAEPYPFNDPELSRQWYLYNPGSGTSSIAGADINVFPAWKSVTGGRSDVIVAVLDGGIDYNHPDLRANMWVNAGEIAGNGIDDDDNGFVDDIYGYRWGYSRTTVPKVDPSGEILPLDHGTHVAGIIGAVNNNGIGVCGVAGGTGKKDGVRLMSCQVFIPNYNTTKTPYDYGETHSVDKIADAYPYAADNGAVIASCSFSASTNSYKEAINYFIKNAGTGEKGNQTGPMKGGIVICAAANDGVDTKVYPAAYEKCISVAGLCWNYVKNTSSNYGNWVTLSAFFGSGYGTASQIYSTYPTASLNGAPAGSGYGYKAGTSQACPQVSGLAALIVSKYGGAGFTPDDVKELLLNTARNVDAYNPGYVGKLGVGVIDAYAALTGKVDVVVDMNPVTDLTGVWDTHSVSLTWSDPNGSGVTEYDIYWSQNSLADVSPEALPSGVKTARIKNTWSSGTTKRTYQITDLISDGAYYIAVAAVNSSEKHRSGWSLLEGRTQAVLEATVDLIAVKDLKVTWNNSSASLTWSDPNNSGVYEYDIYWSRQSLEAISPENPPIGVNKVRIHNTWKLGTGRTYVIRDLEPNSDYSVGIVALNSFGNFRSEMNRTTGRTSVNQAPKRRGDENVRLSLKELVSELIDLDSYFYDPDGDALVYEAVSDDVNKVKVILNDTKLILTAFSGGECSVLVTAKDPYDKQISSLITTWSTSDKPDAVTLKVTWRPSLAELTWLDPNENGVSDYEIFWSQSSLTGISTENPPVNVHKVRVNNTWGSSVERNYVISNLKVSTPYSIGVVAVDRTSGRRSDIYIVSGRTSPVTASR